MILMKVWSTFFDKYLLMILSYCSEYSDLLSVSGSVCLFKFRESRWGKTEDHRQSKVAIRSTNNIYTHTLTQGEDYTTLLFIVYYMRIHYTWLFLKVVVKRDSMQIIQKILVRKNYKFLGSKSQISDIMKDLLTNGWTKWVVMILDLLLWIKSIIHSDS